MTSFLLARFSVDLRHPAEIKETCCVRSMRISNQNSSPLLLTLLLTSRSQLGFLSPCCGIPLFVFVCLFDQYSPHFPTDLAASFNSSLRPVHHPPRPSSASSLHNSSSPFASSSSCSSSSSSSSSFSSSSPTSLSSSSSSSSSPSSPSSPSHSPCRPSSAFSSGHGSLHNTSTRGFPSPSEYPPVDVIGKKTNNSTIRNAPR